MENESRLDSWQNWIAENAGRFLLFARQQCRHESDAEDVLQEALVEAWERSGGRPPDAALVYSTIRRRAIDLARSHDRRTRRELATAEPEHPWFEPDVEDRETQRLLEAAIKNLPEAYAEVMTLKIWGGLTFQQIAELLGIPLNTAASRYRYGLEQLRATLKEVLA